MNSQRVAEVSIHHYVSPVPTRHAVTRARIVREHGADAVSLFAGDELIATTMPMPSPTGEVLCLQLGLVSRPRVGLDDIRREYVAGMKGPAK